MSQETDDIMAALKHHFAQLERKWRDVRDEAIRKQAPLEYRIGELTGERDDLALQLACANRSLADMVAQYMAFPEGYISHEFMSAQEDAIEYLEEIGWLKGGELERYYWTDTALAATKDDPLPFSVARARKDEAAQRDELARQVEELKRLARAVCESSLPHVGAVSLVNTLALRAMERAVGGV